MQIIHLLVSQPGEKIYSINFGDVDGDGLSDILIGSPESSCTGKVYLIFAHHWAQVEWIYQVLIIFYRNNYIITNRRKFKYSRRH